MCARKRVPVSSGDHAARPADPDLRARVLTASVALVEAEGLAALSLREVARRAGVSHQAPYHHFPNRESILAAIAEEGFRELTARLQRTRAIQRTEARAAALARAYLDFALERRAHFRVMFRPELVDLRRFAAVAAAGAAAHAELTAFIDDAVRGRRDAGRRRQEWVLIHWSFVHGFACLLLDGPLEASPEDPGARDRLIEATVREFARRLHGGGSPSTPAAPRGP